MKFKPGDFYINCESVLCCCADVDYQKDDLTGIRISDGTISCCSINSCGPEYVTSWELPFLILLTKRGVKSVISIKSMLWVIDNPQSEQWQDYELSSFEYGLAQAEISIKIIKEECIFGNSEFVNTKKYLDILTKYVETLNDIKIFIEKEI